MNRYCRLLDPKFNQTSMQWWSVHALDSFTVGKTSQGGNWVLSCKSWAMVVHASMLQSCILLLSSDFILQLLRFSNSGFNLQSCRPPRLILLNSASWGNREQTGFDLKQHLWWFCVKLMCCWSFCPMKLMEHGNSCCLHWTQLWSYICQQMQLIKCCLLFPKVPSALMVKKEACGGLAGHHRLIHWDYRFWSWPEFGCDCHHVWTPKLSN